MPIGEGRVAITNKTAHLVVVDDHDLARAGLRDMLADESCVEVVGEASDGREAVELCRSRTLSTRWGSQTAPRRP